MGWFDQSRDGRGGVKSGICFEMGGGWGFHGDFLPVQDEGDGLLVTGLEHGLVAAERGDVAQEADGGDCGVRGGGEGVEVGGEDARAGEGHFVLCWFDLGRMMSGFEDFERSRLQYTAFWWMARVVVSWWIAVDGAGTFC